MNDINDNSRFYDETQNAMVDKANASIDSASIEAKINSIIAKRQERLPNLKNTLEKIDKMSSELSIFKNKKNEFKSKIINSNIIENLSESEKNGIIDNLNNNITDEKIDSIIQKLKETKRSCNDAIRKFEKDNICIAIVGGARNGKSRLIQTITGLDDRIVPTSEDGFCTGARSTIENNENFKVIIEFYTEEELLKKVISQYQNYEEFVKCGSKDINLNSLSDVKDLYNRLYKENIVNGRQYLKRLRDYAEQQDSYKKYLGNHNKELNETQKDEISRFVSQIEKRIESGNEVTIKHYEFLAVKRVSIYCPFEVTTVRKIVLVDTVGLGETSLGIEDDMLDTIKKEADFVLMLRAMSTDPNAILKDEDFKIYNKIVSAISNIEPSKWCYWVLNRRNTNYKMGIFEERYYKALIENFESSKNPHYPAAILNINCSNHDEVMNGLINPMLQHISDNLGVLDKDFIYQLNSKIIDVKSVYQDLMCSINTITASNAEIDLLKNREFNKFYDNFVREIHQFKKDYKEKCNIPQVEVDIICSSFNQYIPSKDEIKNNWLRNNYLITINWAFEQAKSRLSKMLIKTTSEFNVIIDKYKKEIIGKVISLTGLDKCFKSDLDRKDFLNYFIEKVFKNIDSEDLKKNFEDFEKFDIKDEVFLTKILDEACVKYLNVDYNPDPHKPLFPTYWNRESDEDGVNNLFNCLLGHMVGVQNIFLAKEDELKNLPYNRLTKKLESFINDITNQSNENAWREIFLNNSSMLIGDKISELETQTKQLNEWNQIIEELKNNNINEIN